LIEVPIWARSPSPFTFAFWIVLALWGNMQLKRHGIKYKRFFSISRLVDSILIVGLVAFSFDAFWCIAQAFKFGYLYPGDLPELYRCFIRDIAFLILCYLMTYPSLIKTRIIRITKTTKWFVILESTFFLIWFLLAPSPGFTDWTYAIRHAYSSMEIMGAFVISHVIGKFIQGLIFISLWRTKK